jgi:hypothetical protein
MKRRDAGGARRHRWTALRLAAVIGAVAAALYVVPNAFAVSGAAFTSVNEDVDGTGHCQNGNPNVNCNIYDGKEFVWLNGGPATASLGDGSYFFAVLDPGSQADPNDGSSGNLSSPNDAYTDRTFSVSGGVVSYSGPHDFDSSSGKIRLMPYDDTSNPGGVYILAICSLADGVPVDPSSCKYDAFKVQSGEVTSASDLTITKDANGSNSNTFTWGISKDADKTQVNSAGGGVTFTYTVKVTHDSGTIGDVKVSGTISVFNPNVDAFNNTVPVDIDGVTDELSDNTSCSVTNGGAQTLTQFQTDFAYSCDLTALPQGELDNTATVSWPAQLLSNGNLLGANSAGFTFKSISFAETKVDDCVDVTDSVGGALGTVCSSDPSPTSFQYQNTVPGVSGTCTNYDNTATFTTDDTQTTDSAKKTVTVCVGADLQVSKDAALAFKRTYKWAIAKSADKTVIDPGGKVTYTVTASQTGFTDSEWVVTGAIKVHNPNDWEAVTLTGVTDTINNGGVCTVSGNTTQTIAAGGDSTGLTYKCTYASAPSPLAGTNTASATWDKAAAFTPNGTASGTAGANFTNAAPTSTVNKTITVTDTLNGVTTTLGTCTATDPPAAPASCPFTYSRTFTPPGSGCVTITNTAKIVETGQTSSASVKNCNSGALTMGFWQNNNGQTIIKNGASTGGVCNVGTWLRGFAPFQDLSATANCNAVATYVFNVIKGGGIDCGGVNCNALLKAQMLATALNVYFSDPALGGNKINAAAPIGGLKVDITPYKVAFNNQTCMTVSAMLSYAASQSNAGGSAWYAQVKATQERAKSAFDAINNQKVVAC